MHKNVKAGITILICLVCFLFIGFGIQPKMVAAAGQHLLRRHDRQ